MLTVGVSKTLINLSEKKFIENGKNGQFWWVFNLKSEACGQTVLPELVEKAKIKLIKWDIFRWFSGNVLHFWLRKVNKNGQNGQF